MAKITIKILLAVLVLGSAAGMAWWWRQYGIARAGTFTAETGDIVVGVTVSGTIESRQKSAVAAEVVGLVRRLAFSEGQRVSRGDVLVELDDGEIAAECAKAKASQDHATYYLAELKAGPRKEEITKAEELVKQADARLAYAKKDYENLSELAKRGAARPSELNQALTALQVAEAEWNANKAQLALLSAGTRPEQIEQADSQVRLAAAEAARCEAMRAKYTLRATHDGVVTAEVVHVGEVVAPGQVLLRVDNVEDVQVRAQAQETELAGIQPGSPARVIADAYPDQPLRAEVRQILPRVEPESGTVPVLLALTERPRVVLMDGMAVDVALMAKERHGVVRVPASAVEKRADKTIVWLKDGASFQARTVRTGLADGQWVEIVEGLQPGDVVRTR